MPRHVLTILLVCLLAACDSNARPPRIVGTWRSGAIETEWGEAAMQWTFTERDMTTVFTPKSGDAMRTSHPYTLNGDTVASDGFGADNPMRFVIEGDVLILYGGSDPQPLRLHRVRAISPFMLAACAAGAVLIVYFVVRARQRRVPP